jgi:hypothetical protein
LRSQSEYNAAICLDRAHAGGEDDGWIWVEEAIGKQGDRGLVPSAISDRGDTPSVHIVLWMTAKYKRSVVVVAGGATQR